MKPLTSAGRTLERIVRNAMPAADGVADFIVRIEEEAGDRVNVMTLRRALERGLAAVDDEWTIEASAELTAVEYAALVDAVAGTGGRLPSPSVPAVRGSDSDLGLSGIGPIPSQQSAHDHLHIGTAPTIHLSPAWSCMGCGQATDHFAAGSLVHPEDGLCQRCVDAIRAQTDALR